MTYEITMLSGKGGTGKTSVTAAFAHLASRSGLSQILNDLDVDASNLPLLLNPTVLAQHDFVSGEVAVLDREACRNCTRCVRFCKFGALEQLPRRPGQHRGDVVLDPVMCEGCRLCAEVCSHEAITMESKTCGVWYQSETALGPMYHAKLGPGEENSGRLISLLRQQASEAAANVGAHVILSDGPPGIGCPVISAVTGTGAVVCVTEPTASGLHDLQRIVTLVRHFELPAAIVINKYGLNPDVTLQIARYAEDNDLPVLGRIPYSDHVMPALGQGQTLLDIPDVAEAIDLAWQSVWDWGCDLQNRHAALKACS